MERQGPAPCCLPGANRPSSGLDTWASAGLQQVSGPQGWTQAGLTAPPVSPRLGPVPSSGTCTQ